MRASSPLGAALIGMLTALFFCGLSALLGVIATFVGLLLSRPNTATVNTAKYMGFLFDTDKYRKLYAITLRSKNDKTKSHLEQKYIKKLERNPGNPMHSLRLDTIRQG